MLDEQLCTLSVLVLDLRAYETMHLQAERIATSSGIKLPKDFIAAASAGGLRLGALQSYIKLQVGQARRSAPAHRCHWLLAPTAPVKEHLIASQQGRQRL